VPKARPAIPGRIAPAARRSSTAGLIAAAVACVIIGSVQKVGTNLKSDFTSLQNALK